MSNHVRVGIGVIIINTEKKILIGKRANSHAPYYSIPGGHIELGETLEDTAIREVKEETNLIIESPEVIAVTNDLETYEKEGKHYISIILLSKTFQGILRNMEPQKCEGWQWVYPAQLPFPFFNAAQQGIACWLNNTFYEKVYSI
jgi:8-oxo-dGTP diphosphatase